MSDLKRAYRREKRGIRVEITWLMLILLVTLSYMAYIDAKRLTRALSDLNMIRHEVNVAVDEFKSGIEEAGDVRSKVLEAVENLQASMQQIETAIPRTCKGSTNAPTVAPQHGCCD